MFKVSAYCYTGVVTNRHYFIVQATGWPIRITQV